MKERYEGANRHQLIDAIKRHEMISGGDADALANAFADAGQLQDTKKDEPIIVQGANDADSAMFLLIAGRVGIYVHSAEINNRGPGQTVGEMQAIEPSQPRSATVKPLEDGVVLRITSADFFTIAAKFPQVWKPLTRELARRLCQRNDTIPVPNDTPKVFIISSKESLPTATELAAGLATFAYTKVKVWDQNTFFAGDYVLDDLDREVRKSDFAIAVAEPNDRTRSRKVSARTMRDNVLFELGLFMGHLTRRRAFLIHPKVKDLKIPSDIHGLTLISYKNGQASTLKKRLAPVCDQLHTLFQERGIKIFKKKTAS